jgi:hypothetical protein
LIFQGAGFGDLEHESMLLIMNELTVKSNEHCKWLIFRGLSPFFTIFQVFFTAFFSFKMFYDNDLRVLPGVICALFSMDGVFSMKNIEREVAKGWLTGYFPPLRFGGPETAASGCISERSKCSCGRRLARESLKAAPHVQVAFVGCEIVRKWLETRHHIWDWCCAVNYKLVLCKKTKLGSGCCC